MCSEIEIYLPVTGGICGGQSGAEVGFLRVLRSPLPVFILQIAPQSPASIKWGWYDRPVVAAVPSGLSLSPLRIINNNKTGDILRRTTNKGIVRYRTEGP
jgi:hypothetical protein